MRMILLHPLSHKYQHVTIFELRFGILVLYVLVHLFHVFQIHQKLIFCLNPRIV